MTEPTQTPAARWTERGIRCGLLAVFAAGVRRRDPGAIVNGALSFAASSLPDLFERRYGVEFRPWQRAYAETAMLNHAVGMLGPYDDTWWWDHVTHTHSATLFGGLVHVASRRRGLDPRPRVLAAVVGAGLLWELLEYGVRALSRRLGLEPVLVPYSARDTLDDLCFDILGALLVVAFGDRVLGNLAGDE